MAAEGAPHGTVLIADCQTGGRGRMGRSFHSPSGCGIYLSVILRPNCNAEKLMHLTCASGVAACDAVESVTNLRPGIKWINDLVIGKEKLGGILAELSVDPASGKVQYAVVGIGINCAHRAEDFPPEIRGIATSLFLATEKDFDRTLLCAALTEALWRMSKTLLTDKTRIMEQYRKDCITTGQEVLVVRGEEKHYAKAISVADDGSLLVQYADGTEATVSSGEVSIRGMYGYV